MTKIALPEERQNLIPMCLWSYLPLQKWWRNKRRKRVDLQRKKHQRAGQEAKWDRTTGMLLQKGNKNKKRFKRKTQKKTQKKEGTTPLEWGRQYTLTHHKRRESVCTYTHTCMWLRNNIQQNVRVFKVLAVHAHDHLETVSPTCTAL